MLSILFAAILAAPGALRPQPKTAPPQSEDVTPKTELTDDDVRQHVKAYLGSIDTPIQANQWKALGPRAVPMLEEIVKNHDELPTRRRPSTGSRRWAARRRSPSSARLADGRASRSTCGSPP